MSKTSIEWASTANADGSVTPGETWNPVRGCTKVSPGCAHCYAETFAERWRGVKGHAYEQGFDLRLVPDKLDEPLRRKKPTTYFVNSVSDLFHEDVPDQFLVDVFGIMALAHWHTFQVLTKRPERMRSFLAAGDHGILRQFMLLQQNGGTATRHVFRALDIKRRDDIEWRWPLPNVWLGVSVENQHFADKRIPLLLQTPAAVRFISAEPLLGPIDVRWRCADGGGFVQYLPAPGPPDPPRSKNRYLDWVIVGGESGPDARPFDIAWARSIVRQCKASRVPVFVKQLGQNAIVRNDERDEDWPGYTVPIDDDYEPRYQGEEAPLVFHNRKGGNPAEWPEDLRVREMPTVTKHEVA